MNRLGWIILTIVALSISAFALLVDRSAEHRRYAFPATGAAPAILAPSGLSVPVAGVRPEQLTNSWHDARGGGLREHQAIDIMAPRGTPVYAAMAGRVEKLFESKAGGTTAYVRSSDGKWTAYYAHLAAYYPGVKEGLTLRRGQQIGFVGDTGNAGAGNYHLHFGLHRMAPGQRWYEGTPVNPYPLLAAKRDAR